MSTVRITKPEFADLIQSGEVGIGQLFRHLRLLPDFVLLSAARSSDGTFTRQYRLDADGISCLIHETFPANLFSLTPPS